ncbi:MAG TPA: hypothetical protein VF885_26655 [Arthrobacter sp.]
MTGRPPSRYRLGTHPADLKINEKAARIAAKDPKLAAKARQVKAIITDLAAKDADTGEYVASLAIVEAKGDKVTDLRVISRLERARSVEFGHREDDGTFVQGKFYMNQAATIARGK